MGSRSRQEDRTHPDTGHIIDTYDSHSRTWSSEEVKSSLELSGAYCQRKMTCTDYFLSHCIQRHAEEMKHVDIVAVCINITGDNSISTDTCLL